MNTYPDEDVKKVTLLEGSVRVNGNTSHVIIKRRTGIFCKWQNTIKPSVNINQVMAGKKECLIFTKLRFTAVMRQLGRWYDIDIVYARGVPELELGGEIQKSLSLTEMLEALGALGVKFKNKKIER